MWAGIGLDSHLKLSTKQTMSSKQAGIEQDFRIAAYEDFEYITEHDEASLLIVLGTVA